MTDARPWTYAALFGALWGALELTVGTVINLSQIPMAGSLMGLIGLVCLITLRRLQPRPGVCLLAGIVAVFLKIFASGGLRPAPLFAIAAEAVLVELAMTGLGGRWLGAVVGGALTLAKDPLLMAVVVWAVAPPEALDAYLRSAQAVLGLVGLGDLSPLAILGLLMILNGAVGALGGYGAWRIGGRVECRLGRRP